MSDHELNANFLMKLASNVIDGTIIQRRLRKNLL